MGVTKQFFFDIDLMDRVDDIVEQLEANPDLERLFEQHAAWALEAIDRAYETDIETPIPFPVIEHVEAACRAFFAVNKRLEDQITAAEAEAQVKGTGFAGAMRRTKLFDRRRKEVSR